MNYRFGSSSRFFVMFFLTTLILPGCGKSPPGDEPSDADSTPRAMQPDAVLERMIAAYQQAASYSDRGVVSLRYRLGSQWLEDQAPLSVRLERPNRLRIEAYRLTLACDGEELRAKIQDPASRDMDGQVVVRPAPARLSLPDLYADTVLYSVVSSGLGRHPVQLEMLLGEEPLKAFLAPESRKRLLADTVIERRPCWRVEITTQEGPFVLCVDREEFILRRVEYPTKELVAQMARTADVREARLAADFREARFGGETSEDAFRLEVPEGAKQVRYFVLPPQPLPSDLFGRQPGDFHFTDLAGGRVSREMLQGKIAVLAWVHDDANSQATLQELEKVRLRMAGDDKIAFYAVCTQPMSVSNGQLRELFDQWRVALTPVRDIAACGRDVFRIPGAPTLVVLDERGVVQILEAGFHPGLAAELPGVLDRVRAGQDVGGEVLRQFQQEQETYARSLADAQKDDAQPPPAPGRAVAAAADPTRLRLTRQWSTDQLKAPGNILVLRDEAAEPTLLVLDGWRTVVQLNLRGEVVARRELELPDEAAVSYLRTAVDGQGRRRLAGAAFRSRQFHLFDATGRRLLSYPDEGQTHQGVQDVQLADLDEDGRLEAYVGFWGLPGVHRVSEEGKRVWGNRALENVLSLALETDPAAGERGLLAAGERGVIVRIPPEGRAEQTTQIPGRAIFYLFAAEFPGPATTAYCAFTYDAQGHLTALGLDPQLRETWSYAMPAGTFQHPVQFVASAPLLDVSPGQWVIAAPDGSVHLISDDGRFFDKFSWGRLLSGLAVARVGDQRWLIASSDGQVTAWSVALADSAPAP